MNLVFSKHLSTSFHGFLIAILSHKLFSLYISHLKICRIIDVLNRSLVEDE